MRHERARSSRRPWHRAVPLFVAWSLGFLSGAVTSAAAAGDRDDAPADARLESRLGLWHNYAKRTRRLAASITISRTSSLLREPLVRAGTLVFEVPDRLVLRDDASDGAVTTFRGDEVTLASREQDAPPIVRKISADAGALSFVANVLRAVFAPLDPAELRSLGRVTAGPRGYVLEFFPRAGALRERRLVRSIVVRLDPVGGAVVAIEIHEAQGDRVVIALSDHRQNAPSAEAAASPSR